MPQEIDLGEKVHLKHQSGSFLKAARGKKQRALPWLLAAIHAAINESVEHHRRRYCMYHIGVSGICKVVRPGSGCGHLVMCANSC